jgi:hypothetical protein
MQNRRPALIALGALLLVGCSAAPPSDEPLAAASDPVTTAITLPVPQTVLPQTTDPAIKTTLLPHTYAAPPSGVTPNGKLLVFFPGSLAQANEYEMIIAQAAAMGFYAVGVSYPNGAPDLLNKTLTMICESNTGGSTANPDDCYDEVRHNRFDGTPEPHYVKPGLWQPQPSGTHYDPYYITSPTEAIQHRLGALLTWLGSNAVQGSHSTWASFVSNGTPKYSLSYVLGGHSQGGGEAAYIAKMFSVQGVMMFSSPEDAGFDPTTGLAAWSAHWLLEPNWATSTSRFIGLTHELDEFGDMIGMAWQNMGVNATNGGAFARYGHACADGPTLRSLGMKEGPAPSKSYQATYCNNDGGLDPAYTGAHLLYTDVQKIAPITFPFPYHSTTVVDKVVPRCPTNSANPALLPAWRQMMYVAAGINATAPATCQ